MTDIDPALDLIADDPDLGAELNIEGHQVEGAIQGHGREVGTGTGGEEGIVPLVHFSNS